MFYSAGDASRTRSSFSCGVVQRGNGGVIECFRLGSLFVSRASAHLDINSYLAGARRVFGMLRDANYGWIFVATSCCSALSHSDNPGGGWLTVVEAASGSSGLDLCYRSAESDSESKSLHARPVSRQHDPHCAASCRRARLLSAGFASVLTLEPEPERGNGLLPSALLNHRKTSTSSRNRWHTAHLLVPARRRNVFKPSITATTPRPSAHRPRLTSS